MEENIDYTPQQAAHEAVEDIGHVLRFADITAEEIEELIAAQNLLREIADE